MTYCRVVDPPCDTLSTVSSAPGSAGHPAGSAQDMSAPGAAGLPATARPAQGGPVGLQHLELFHVSSSIPDNTWKCMQPALLPHLSSLTHLSFKEVTGVKGLRPHMTAFESLQQLHVRCRPGSTSGCGMYGG
jgi:hypothetical protein